jgi:hypothetical protein
MAVGYYHSTVDLAVAATWNGGSWHDTGYPVPPISQVSDLWGVSCPVANFCMAVGDYMTVRKGSFPYADRWDGKKWHSLAVPSPKSAVASHLDAVSCTSISYCMAVGYYDIASNEFSLAEMWNGSKWTVVTAPSPTPLTDLFSVSCTAKPDWCMATGDFWAPKVYYSTLTEEWNGSKWSRVASPSPTQGYGSYLFGISCNNPSACVAAGSWEQTAGNVNVIDRWHGKGWFTSAPVNVKRHEGELTAVSCEGPNNCWAVGYEAHWAKTIAVGATEAEFWNGSRWSLVPTPNGPKSNGSELYGVSCPGPTTCVAVGHWVAPVTLEVFTLAEIWNGQKWTRSNSPNP